MWSPLFDHLWTRGNQIFAPSHEVPQCLWTSSKAQWGTLVARGPVMVHVNLYVYVCIDVHPRLIERRICHKHLYLHAHISFLCTYREIWIYSRQITQVVHLDAETTIKRLVPVSLWRVTCAHEVSCWCAVLAHALFGARILMFRVRTHICQVHLRISSCSKQKAMYAPWN